MTAGNFILLFISALIVVAVYITFFSAPKTAGLGHLERYLRRNGTDPKAVPKRLKEEIVLRSEASANMSTLRHPQSTPILRSPTWNSEFEGYLKMWAELLHFYRVDPQVLSDWPGIEEDFNFFESHGYKSDPKA